MESELSVCSLPHKICLDGVQICLVIEPRECKHAQPSGAKHGKLYVSGWFDMVAIIHGTAGKQPKQAGSMWTGSKVYSQVLHGVAQTLHSVKP